MDTPVSFHKQSASQVRILIGACDCTVCHEDIRGTLSGLLEDATDSKTHEEAHLSLDGDGVLHALCDDRRVVRCC